MSEKKSKIIINRLKNLRINNKISQKDLAASIGTSVQTITQIETFNREPSLDLIEKYGVFFNVGIEEIVKDIIPTTSKVRSVEEELDKAKESILNIFPVAIPVYSHREYLDPKIKNLTTIDRIYWHKDKLKNRNLFAIHVQTANLYPDIETNDRLIIDPDLPLSSGIGLCFDGRSRSNFANSQGIHLVNFQAGENGKFYYNNNFDEVRRLVKPNFYKGMAIQKISPLPIRGINLVHKDLEAGIDLESMRRKK